jgi:pyruvate formate lyase activating enzyme
MTDIAFAPRGHSEAPTRYWHQLDDGRVQCDLCPRFCRLSEGQRGFCFVRANAGGKVVLTTYGRSSGFVVDPIEKKPLNHFLPGTPVLSFGTAGCNLGCRFCQNWDISKSRESDTLASAAMPEALALAAERLGCPSVAFTYNDPVIFMEYAIDVARRCHEHSIQTVAVTTRYITEAPRREFFAHIDAANVDLKAFSESFYSEVCSGGLGAVLDTLVYLRQETDVWFEITNLVIPGKNDSPEEIDRMTRWIAGNLGADTPVHFSRFHPDFRMLDREPTSPETLLLARSIAIGNGLKYVYTGNIHHPESGSTYCHGCGRATIVRDWYELGAWGLDDRGRCRSCGEPCAGIFDGPPGSWGPRRVPVNMDDFVVSGA